MFYVTPARGLEDESAWKELWNVAERSYAMLHLIGVIVSHEQLCITQLNFWRKNAEQYKRTSW